MKSIAAKFREDWEVAIAGVGDVSAGAVRALRAHADVEVAETVEAIQDHASSNGPNAATAFLTAWLTWHPVYVAAEIKRMLPELMERWPTREVRTKREIARQRRKQWGDDGARIVETMGGAPWPKSVLRAHLGLKPGRFDRLVTSLVRVRAVSEYGENLLATAPAHWAREKILALVSPI